MDRTLLKYNMLHKFQSLMENQLNNKNMFIPFHFLSIEDMNTIQKKERDTDHKLSFTQTICTFYKENMWALRTIVLSRSLSPSSDRKLIFLIYYEIFYRARFLLANISHLSDDLIVLLFYGMQYLSGSNKMYLNEPGTKSMISNIKNIQFYFVLSLKS